LVKQKSLRFPYAFLEGSEHHHLSRVLRARPGQRVWLVDEKGVRFLAEVRELDREKTKLLILERQEAGGSKIRLSLAQAVLKSKKMDFIIQKATELGIAFFIPILAARSIAKVREEEKKVSRWQRIAQEAAKQARRMSVPSVLSPQPFFSFLQGLRAGRKFFLVEGRGRLLREIIIEDPPGQRLFNLPAVNILIGPEGGWTEEEEKQALDNGFEAVSLGDQILRSETAALAALSLVAHFWNV
jgi:16S rRNA (uracil1498-N3)-methyltransferase